VINELGRPLKGILTVELSAGQMIEDVRLSVNGKVPVAALWHEWAEYTIT